MNDLDLLTGSIAARIRALAGVERLYPPQRRVLGVPGTGGGVLAALGADDAVAADLRDGVLHVQVSLAVDGRRATAPDTLRAVADLIDDQLDAAAVDRRRLTIRVASVSL